MRALDVGPDGHRWVRDPDMDIKLPATKVLPKCFVFRDGDADSMGHGQDEYFAAVAEDLQLDQDMVAQLVELFLVVRPH